ncbi:Protein CBG17899 [Caenorhabditis briggsae]|uniref:glucuronosyltransferase n=2 Tax=Caenorhabditis briggsae TaxID=6238 RepID=A8XS22_CAEBR|nr:Protein CBG17899 [Caenorhabditis briggsae]CAP35441.1 Protein CBG17899 [Caenorhabditis briggsae]
MPKFIILICLIFTLLFPVEPLKVLVYSPAFGGSHTNYMARLADTLTESGHNVTFFMPIIDESRRNQLGVKLTKDVIKLEQDQIMRDRKISIDKITGKFWTLDVTSKNGRLLYETFYEQVILLCGNLFRNTKVIEELRSRKFDVAIFEPLMTCALALFRHLEIENVVMASSCPNYDMAMAAMGEPADTSYVPAVFADVSGDRMDFSNRLENHDMYHLMLQVYTEMFDDEAKVYRSFLGEDFPDWRDLIPDASLHFTNSIPHLDFPRPSIQKSIDIGGISVDVEKIRSEVLSDEWDQILDEREKNVFLSFGSMAKSFEMPDDFKKNLVDVFRLKPNVTFIWKYESDDVDFARGVQNVKFVKWAPQTALLNDHRLNAFLGHGGLGSTYESAFLGKPSIMVPIFFDQSRNSNMMSRLGTTITLHKRDLGNFKKLREAFSDILYNSKYVENAQKVANMLRDQPLKPKDLVVKYIEFVGKYGPFHHMTPYSVKMPWIPRYNYDIYFYKFSLFLSPCLLVFVGFSVVKRFLRLRLLKKIE